MTGYNASDTHIHKSDGTRGYARIENAQQNPESKRAAEKKREIEFKKNIRKEKRSLCVTIYIVYGIKRV